MSEQFGKIYDQYVERIYRFIVLKVETQEVAEDLCSEVFLRVFGEFQKDSIENIQAFLYQVARYIIADHYRQRASMKIVSIEGIEELFEENSLFDGVVVRSDMEEVRRAIGLLRDEYQNLIIWRYLDELSIPEIAKIIGKTEGSVRVGVHSALGALKAHLPNPALNTSSSPVHL